MRASTVRSWAPRGKLPCASGTYSTQEASTRSPYVQYGGPGRTCKLRSAQLLVNGPRKILPLPAIEARGHEQVWRDACR